VDGLTDADFLAGLDTFNLEPAGVPSNSIDE